MESDSRRSHEIAAPRRIAESRPLRPQENAAPRSLAESRPLRSQETTALGSAPEEAHTYRSRPWHDAMIAELLSVSAGLVYDPAAAEHPEASPLHQELRAIDAALRAAEQPPRPRRENIRFDARSIAEGARRGALRRTNAVPSPIVDPRLDPAATAIRQRLREIVLSAEAAIRSIESSRRYRDMPIAGNTTLYESVDVPRLRMLRDALRVARALASRAAHISGIPVSTRQILRSRAVFTRKAQRPVSALYERWVYLQIVKAFHGALDSTLAQMLLNDFGGSLPPDFDERTQYVKPCSNGRTLRIRFEPWILTRELAIVGEHGLYRGAEGAHAWRPDAVIQIEQGTRAGIPVVESAWIIDAKLASLPRRELWEQVLKYAQIRSAINDTPVVQQVALALPAADDGGIALYESLPPDPPVALFVLPLLPGSSTPASQNALKRLITQVMTQR